MVKESENAYFIVKFIELEFINDFIEKGTIHFSKISDIQLWEKNGNNYQGDKYEGTYTVEDSPEDVAYFFRLEDSTEPPVSLPFEKARKIIKNPAVNDMQIASFARLDLMHDFDYVAKTDTGSPIYSIKYKTLKALTEISDGRPCVITSFDSFKKQWFKYFSIQNIESYMELIRYVDRTNRDDEINAYKLDDIKFAKQFAFEKRTRYKKQRELRILLPYDKTNEFGNISIGELNSQYTKKFNSINDLANLRAIILNKNEEIPV